MADIDRAAFAVALSATLAVQGLSLRGAVARWPELDVAMLSRATRCKPLSAGNFLLVCRLLKLSPWRFLRREKVARKPPPGSLKSILKTMRKQAVTAPGFP